MRDRKIEMKVRKTNLPQSSILSNWHSDYSDSYSVDISNIEREINSVEIGKAFFASTPRWVDGLLNIRNNIVKCFGLKTGIDPLRTKEEIINNFQGNIGESIGLFKVFDRNDTEIIFGENDKHLNFRVSMLIGQQDKTSKYLTISTCIKFNNKGGNLYFLPVKPFHKIIIPIMLKSTVKELGKNL